VQLVYRSGSVASQIWATVSYIWVSHVTDLGHRVTLLCGVCVYIASLFGAPASAGSFGFATTTPAGTLSAAAAAQPSGFMAANTQPSMPGFTFGVATLGSQPQTSSTQTTAAFGLQTAAASTAQSGGFQLGAVQPSSSAAAAAAPGGFGLGAGLLTSAATTSAGGYMFGAVPSTSTGFTGLLGNTTQTGTSSLFATAKPGTCVMNIFIFFQLHISC